MARPNYHAKSKDVRSRPLPQRPTGHGGRDLSPITNGELLPDDVLVQSLPDHTQLPEEDGTFVKNFQEHPQSILLTDSITPVLQRLHPDGQYAIGQDSGIYWDTTHAHDTRPERWAKSPDWYYVPNVPPLLDGDFRGSYVYWHEKVVPVIVIEFVSGNGKEERDATPHTGKFWVYEQGLGVPYYAIFRGQKRKRKASLDVYHLEHGKYQKMKPNAHRTFEIAPMDVALGLWCGQYQNITAWWLRWWDRNGNLLPTSEERNEQILAHLERERQEKERERLEKERERREKEQALAHLERERREKEQALAHLERERLEKEQLVARLHALGIPID